MLCCFKKLDDGQIPKSNIVFGNFSHAVFSLLCKFGNAGLGLVPHGPVQSDPVWCGPVQPFIHEFKTA
jgi:hypothetical protein